MLEIIDARYTFLNEPLAAHYKIDGVKGPEMRRVSLADPSAAVCSGTRAS